MAAPATRHVFDAATSPFAIPAKQHAALAGAIARAVRAARHGTERLAAVSWRLDRAIDPSAVVFASRRAGEPWICFEQPDRDGAALAGLGSAVTLEDHGPGRFDRVARRWQTLAAEACAEPVEGPPGSGLVAAGGLAFADDGASALHWSAFAPASLVVPEVAFARGADEVWCTVSALARSGDSADELLARVEARIASLRSAPLPLLDPHPAERRSRQSTTRPPWPAPWS
jgi:salicylate biosynthesis isochorismate synthase/menaquinone-specific isochorismate synthase